MKDLKALFDEIKGSGELQAKLADALKNSGLADFLKENDCDARPEDILAVLQAAAGAGNGEAMSAEDMDAVAGGAGSAVVDLLTSAARNTYYPPNYYSSSAPVLLTPVINEEIWNTIDELVKARPDLFS